MPSRLPTSSDLPADLICSVVSRKILTPLLFIIKLIAIHLVTTLGRKTVVPLLPLNY